MKQLYKLMDAIDSTLMKLRAEQISISIQYAHEMFDVRLEAVWRWDGVRFGLDYSLAKLFNEYNNIDAVYSHLAKDIDNRLKRMHKDYEIGSIVYAHKQEL